MISISVCLIVKNEEENLENCLNCVKCFADEIIIADTGSTDKTISIAKNFTNKVYKIWWQDDFAKARNYTFSKAKSSYIFWLDADDIISEENQIKLIKLKKLLPETIDMVMMKYINCTNDKGEPTSFFYRERLIRNTPNFRWVGFLHEVIPVQGNVIYEDISIIHNKPKNKRYTKRNLKIYQKAIKENRIFSNRDIYYYGRELFYHNQYNKAISTLKKFVNSEKNNMNDVFEANLIIGDCFALQKKYDKAIKFYLENFKIAIPSPKLFCKIADIFFQQNNLSSAIFWYQFALTNTNNSSQMFIDKDYEGIIPSLQLCVCYYKLGDFNTAKYYNSLAEKLSPNHSSVIHNKKIFN